MPKSPRVAALIVSFNTREMTLQCLRTIRQGALATGHEVILVDNASSDGSAEAIARDFPEFRLVARQEDLGYARVNNLAGTRATTDRLLLLDLDTLVNPEAIDDLKAFADRQPKAGIWGGRSCFGDGSPNPTSCWRRPTPWNVFCSASGLACVFKGSRLFNPESVGVRGDRVELPIDIATGCPLLIGRGLWNKLDGFDPTFFMYGEDADLYLRAGTLGTRPMVTASATIVHYGGQSDRVRPERLVRLYRTRRQLYDRHWNKRWLWWIEMGSMMNMLRRRLVARVRALSGKSKPSKKPRTFSEVLARRNEWTGKGALGEMGS